MVSLPGSATMRGRVKAFSLHHMRFEHDSVGFLQFANVSNDGAEFLVGYSLNGRHIPEFPMVRTNAHARRQEERFVGVMSRVVDLVYERWPLIRSRPTLTVACRTTGFEQDLPPRRTIRKSHGRSIRCRSMPVCLTFILDSTKR
jgi:hypothetical protein